ncbi:MAG: flavodoxin domain-containing protein [Anderseniella sp.]|nr:flavodoxin domain-containing protein [Anderseniella sp.]
MRIAIIYATTEGQTLKLARRAAELCNEAGHEVELLDAVQVRATLVMDPYEAAILLSSVHISHYQAAMSTFLNDYKDDLTEIPNAFVSVSLSAASTDDDDVEGLRQITDDFYKQTGFTPLYEHLAAGAFRFTRYDFFKRWAMKLIAQQKGIKADTSKDLELTDWPAYDAFIKQFLAEIRSISDAA